MSVDVVGSVETRLFDDFEIACSGKGHIPGNENHGDLTKGAEWYIKHACARCAHSEIRPVCDAFVGWLESEPDMEVYCPMCLYVEKFVDNTWVLCRISSKK